MNGNCKHRARSALRRHWTAGLPLYALAFALHASGAYAENAGVQSRNEYRDGVLKWRQQRENSLRSEHGWLSLVALEWLEEGDNRLGHAAGNDIRLQGGPDYWGTLQVEGKRLYFQRAEGSEVTVDGLTPDFIALVADDSGEPTVIQSGTMALRVIYRESYALRVSDSRAPARVNFQGLDYFEVQPEWLVEGKFLAALAGETIEIANVLGQVSATPVYGTFEFVRGDDTYRLTALGDETSESLWFIYADRTNGSSTYGAGRFLYSEGLPQEGRLRVDFNKSYNPPCAFNEYSTCPLPPPQNRLDLAVTAGEMQFRTALSNH